MEHHSNIVPWQMLCEEKGAKLRVIPINDRGELILEEYEKLLESAHPNGGGGARFERAGHHQSGARDHRDGAPRAALPCWSTARRPCRTCKVDVQALDCDFYAFSGHKMFGPTGIGVLYGKTKLLNAMPPYQGGGDMIRSVTFEKTTYNDAALQVRSRHAEHRRRHRPGRGARLSERDRHGQRSRPTSTNCWSTAPSSCRGSRACA